MLYFIHYNIEDYYIFSLIIYFSKCHNFVTLYLGLMIAFINHTIKLIIFYD